MTLVTMKHVGVNVAADPLMTMTYTGLPGGLVLLSADDPGAHSSQNEQDNRTYARFANMPCFEPSTAQEANGTPNALLLVVGYTDAVGSEEYNQSLSERRAGRVVNHLQQQCRWAPYRMMTPSGMAESDPAADNNTPEGRAQNRRVSVSILVSRAVEGM